MHSESNMIKLVAWCYGELPNISKLLDFETKDDREVLLIIKRHIINLKNKHGWSVEDCSVLVELMFDMLKNFGILQKLIDDNTISEIMVNGIDGIYIEKFGVIRKLEYGFISIHQVEDLVQKIVGRVNKSINEKSPIVDLIMENGSRVNIVLNPVAINGPIITIRKFPEIAMKLSDLIKNKTINSECAEYLKKQVIGRKNIFICGGTSSGKTTLLNALTFEIPIQERIVTIEDSAELSIERTRNLVRLEARKANTAGVGEIPISELIKTSLRMRPNRIVVGEVRGAEVLDMLTAMNTGHDGSISTGHANSANDMLLRLETMVLLAARLPLEAIKKQITSAIDIVVFISKGLNGSRKVEEICELDIDKNGEYLLKKVFVSVEC